MRRGAPRCKLVVVQRKVVAVAEVWNQVGQKDSREIIKFPITILVACCLVNEGIIWPFPS